MKRAQKAHKSTKAQRSSPCVTPKARLRKQIFSSEYTEMYANLKKSKASSKFGRGEGGHRNSMELKTHFFKGHQTRKS